MAEPVGRNGKERETEWEAVRMHTLRSKQWQIMSQSPSVHTQFTGIDSRFGWMLDAGCWMAGGRESTSCCLRTKRDHHYNGFMVKEAFRKMKG